MVRKLRGHVTQIADDIFVIKSWITNVVLIGEPGRDWVLVDAGIGISAHQIRRESERLYGGIAPKTILLTHGHFDHVGSLKTLMKDWDVSVYAHGAELPYLTGKAKYSSPSPGSDPMGLLSVFYQNDPIDLGSRIRELASDHTVEGLPDWEWLYTPGHTPGHVSYFRNHDKVLIAGDAMITTEPDSVLLIESMEPRMMVSGHGPALEAEKLKSDLRRAASLFGPRGIPGNGYYTQESFSERASSQTQ